MRGVEDMKQIVSGQTERGKGTSDPGFSQKEDPKTRIQVQVGHLEGDPRKHRQEGWRRRQGDQAANEDVPFCRSAFGT